MIRGYAVGLGAGSQPFTEGIGGALFGTGEVRTDLAKAAGWVLNLVIAEWAIRRPGRRRTARRPDRRRDSGRGADALRDPAGATP
jgi:hypothetical protein